MVTLILPLYIVYTQLKLNTYNAQILAILTGEDVGGGSFLSGGE